jgi:hypothetical protein
MSRHREEGGERLVERVVARIAAGVNPAAPEELRRRARAAATPREPQAREGAGGRAAWRPMRLRWTLGAAALILFATGLGFGFGAWLTPAGSAGRGPVGLGFLPAEGWTVVQAEAPGGAGFARAVAANVPIDPQDRAGAQPLATLESLPPGGIVVQATLSSRGQPGVDARFPVRSTPLRLADAASVAAPGDLVQYVLRAAVGGYDVDARIYFGSEPTDTILAEADRQLQRLVVAADQVTLAVRPTIAVAGTPITAYGSVGSGRAGQSVTLQFKQCGLYPAQFRDVVELKTSDGGGWSADVGPDANGAFRATSGDATSNEVKVVTRADVRLSLTRSGGYQAYVVARASFWHRHVVIERYDPRKRRWLRVTTLQLENAGAAPGSVYVSSTTKTFSPKVPKETTIRAVLPIDQAKPCYIGGYSTLIRT